ncbi:MAG: response regulator [Candidatus Dadabacteria bacterium]|nr:response regulator [Candidatus Dadabacteria bacterium]
MNTVATLRQERAGAPREKILIVDDEDAIRNLFVEALNELGYDCDVARNGLECLEKFYRVKNFDVVLLDVQMPELNGIETLKKLKSYSPDLSVIMVSASRDIENVRAALKEGAYDYVFKPFNVIDVDAVIRRALERAALIKANKDYQKNLERKVADQTRELVKLYSGTLEAMILALDLREHETGHHSYRVTEYALNLGRHLELDESQLSVMAKGALLHDIGKIGVPDNILLKPDKLTDEEWGLMKQHAQLGYELLNKIEFLEESSLIVYTHHERYDGKGYPRGLSGADIPLGARIFSVVDALDAMTSKRVYKGAMPFEEAIERIKKASGTQFDPMVVETFVNVPVEEWKNIRKMVATTGSQYLKGLMFELSKPRF